MKNKYKIINIIVLVLLIACIACIVLLLTCKGGSAEKQDKQSDTVQDVETTKPLEDDVTDEEFSTDEPEMTEIENPYCSFEYPKELYDSIEIKEVEGPGVYTQHFDADINGHEVRLFSLHFGVNAEGDLMGYIPHVDAHIAFSIEISMVEYDDSWTDEDKHNYETMLDSVNIIYQNISSIPGFTQA